MEMKKFDVETIKKTLKGMKRHKWFLVASGILAIILGIYAMFHPATAILSLAVYVGVGFLLMGISHVAFYFFMRQEGNKPTWFLVLGILELIVAFVMLANLGVTALSIPIMVAFWALFDGVTRCTAAFDLKELGEENWWILLVAGIVSILFALILIARPLAGIFAVTFLLGFTLISWGVGALFEAFHLYR